MFMKKLLSILLAMLCMFSCFGATIYAEDDQQSTEVQYEVEGTYEWSVPADVNLKLEDGLEVAITKCNIDSNSKLVITVESQNEDAASKQWNLVSGNTSISYKVTSDDGKTIWVNGTKVLSNPGTNIITEGDDPVKNSAVVALTSATPSRAGKYKDILTFTAGIVEASMPKKGDVITLDDEDDKTENDYKYLVMDVDGTEAKLLCTNSFYETVTVGGSNNVAYAGGNYFYNYFESTVRNFMISGPVWLTPFCNTLSEKVQNAIVEKTITVNAYEKKSTYSEGDYCINNGDTNYYYSQLDYLESSAPEKVSILDLKDIFDYFEKDSLTASEIKSVFTFSSHNKTAPKQVSLHLRSAIKEGSLNGAARLRTDGIVYYIEPAHTPEDYEKDYEIFPVVYIDLADIEYQKVNE